MICDERQRSVEHFAQCIRLAWPFNSLPSGGGRDVSVEAAVGTGVGVQWNGLLDVDTDVHAVEMEVFVDVLVAIEDEEKVLSQLSLLP